MSKFIALLCAAAVTMTASSAVFAADAAADTTNPTKAVEATEAPTETADEATETPDAEATKAPDADATETPDAEATETPDADATKAPETTEAPTETATEAPTEAPTVTPTEAPDETEATANPFEDCQDEWFTDAVTYAYSNGLIKGVDETHFNPQDNVTRDELAVILYRLSSDDADIVTEGEHWADEAEAWVVENSLMADFISDAFEGSTALTREQIISTMYKTYQLTNETADVSDFAINEFVDADSITDYAVNAVRWAIKSGIIEGNDESEINPAANVTRAETAAILQRYLTKLTFSAPADDADSADKEDAADTSSDAADTDTPVSDDETADDEEETVDEEVVEPEEDEPAEAE